MAKEKKAGKPAWMTEELGEQHLPAEKPKRRGIHLELQGSLSRRRALMRSVLLDMPEGLKDRFRASISGSMAVGILILAETKLAELEEAGEVLKVDVEAWREETAGR